MFFSPLSRFFRALAKPGPALAAVEPNFLRRAFEVRNPAVWTRDHRFQEGAYAAGQLAYAFHAPAIPHDEDARYFACGKDGAAALYSEMKVKKGGDVAMLSLIQTNPAHGPLPMEAFPFFAPAAVLIGQYGVDEDRKDQLFITDIHLQTELPEIEYPLSTQRKTMVHLQKGREDFYKAVCCIDTGFRQVIGNMPLTPHLNYAAVKKIDHQDLMPWYIDIVNRTYEGLQEQLAQSPRPS